MCKYGIATECSLLMLHLTDVYYYADIAMKDVFVVITSIGVGKYMTIKDSLAWKIHVCYHYYCYKKQKMCVSFQSNYYFLK